MTTHCIFKKLRVARHNLIKHALMQGPCKVAQYVTFIVEIIES